jgi:hypothetical protein
VWQPPKCSMRRKNRGHAKTGDRRNVTLVSARTKD